MSKWLIVILSFVVLVRFFSLHHTKLEGKQVRLTGVLAQEPREVGTNLLINLNGYRAFVPRNPDVVYGSNIILEGVVEGQDLKNVRVISVIKPTSLLARARERILSTIHQTFSEPVSSFVAGISIGAPNIPKQFMDALRRTGTSHIVVASGGNLAILAGFLESIMPRFFKRRTFILINSVILLLYSILTGFGAPIVRALFMWSVISAAQFSGRIIKPTQALMYSILFMLILRPEWLLDVSFQLSVGATSAIILFAKPLQKRIKVPFIKEALGTSIAAQIGILPVSIFVFHDVNVFSPIWNTLVLWVVPYLTIIGLIGSILSLIWIPLAQVVLFLGYPFAWYFVKVISLA